MLKREIVPEAKSSQLADEFNSLVNFDDQAQVPVRRSMTIGKADDPAERQADKMAASALATLGNYDESQISQVQRQATSDPLGGTDVDPNVQSQIDSKRGGGQALGEREATSFSSAYGVDLSGVRVHADSQADALSRSLQADAFTTGNDVFFRGGQYKPGTSEGDRLIGHELAHVATESGGSTQRSIHRFVSQGEFDTMTYEGWTTMKSAAQKTILDMLKEYAALGAVGSMKPEILPEALAKIEGMITISDAWINDHQEIREIPAPPGGEPSTQIVADTNRAKRHAGFVQFIELCKKERDALNAKAGATGIDTTAVTPDARVEKLSKHYAGDTTPIFEKAGTAIDQLLPENGMSASFEIEFTVPIPPGFVGAKMSLEGSRDGGKSDPPGSVEMKAQIMVTGGASVGIADIKAGLGGYVAAKGKTATQAAQLMEYALNRRLAESSLVPWEVSAFLFGGSADTRGKRRAEKTNAKTEKDAFGAEGDDENYAESGAAAELGADLGELASVGVAGNIGKRTDKKSLEMAGKTAGDKNEKAEGYINTMTGGARGAEKSTGRSIRGISASASLSAPVAVDLGFSASWIAVGEKATKENPKPARTFELDSCDVELSCEELPMSSILGEAGAEMAMAAIEKVQSIIAASNEKTADEREKAMLDVAVEDAQAKIEEDTQAAILEAADIDPAAMAENIGLESAQTSSIGFALSYSFKDKELEFKLTKTKKVSISVGVASVEAKKTETLKSVKRGGSEQTPAP